MKTTSKATIVKKLWDAAPKCVKKSTEGAIIVSMAAGLLAAPAKDECGMAAVRDMAHDLSYTWDPFDGFCA